VRELKVLVTGGSGFIGSHLVKRLTSDGYEVVVLVRDVLPSPWSNWLNEALKGAVQARGDVLDFNVLRRAVSDYECEAIFHLAAQAVVRKAQADPSTTVQTNVLGTLNVLEAARQLDIPFTYVMSTDKVYFEGMDKKEEDALQAGEIYGTSKAMADLLAQSYAKTYGLKIAIGRACNCYGYDPSPRIIPNTIRSCLKGESPIIYRGEETLRQYIYVNDLVTAIIHLAENKLTGIYNIATNDILTQEQVVLKILENFPTIKPKYVQREKPVKEIQKQSMNWNKIKNTGWTPKYSFEAGIKETIQKFQKYGF
jgi:nucleoside-diphosphate-sugar epimerase